MGGPPRRMVCPARATLDGPADFLKATMGQSKKIYKRKRLTQPKL